MGPIEENVRLNVSVLPADHPMSDALAEMAYGLAKTLDEGAGLIQASVNRELRAVLADLASTVDEGDDDDLSALLSATVEHPED